MRRTTPLAILSSAQTLVTLMALAFYLKVRPDLVASARHLPRAAAFALGPLALPLVVCVGTGITLAGVAIARGARRLRLVATGLAISGLGFSLLALTAFASLLLG